MLSSQNLKFIKQQTFRFKESIKKFSQIYCTGTCGCAGNGWFGSIGGLTPLTSLYGFVISSSNFGSEITTWSGNGFFGPTLPI